MLAFHSLSQTVCGILYTIVLISTLVFLVTSIRKLELGTDFILRSMAGRHILRRYMVSSMNTK